MTKRKNEVVDVELVEDFIPDTQPVVLMEKEKQLDISSDDHRRRILSLCNNIKENYLELAMLLHAARVQNRYESWGYATFKEYANRELGIKYTKAKYLADIWLHFGKNEQLLGKVKEVGWDKLKDLTRVVTEENVDTWVEKAKLLTADDLKKEVKGYLTSMVPNEPDQALANEDAVKGTPVEHQLKSITYQFQHESYMVVCQTIDKIKSVNPQIQSNAECIALACAEFLGSNDFEAEGIDFALQALRRYASVFSLKLTAHDADGNQVL
jgi:hypothetical protein